jgi:beta-1,4-mannosyl-glycoprotein beta-1,4-N-acetylglucosaminyltransferase
MRARLFDCFTFFDELEVLELRLAELADVVDYFVLVESTLTFSGRPKPLFFLENRARFRPYLHKIEHIVLSDNDFPDAIASAWDREHFSRRAMLRGLTRASPVDFVLISDVDEIPRPELLSKALSSPETARRLTVFESTCYVYFFNLKAHSRPPSVVQAPRLLQRRYVRDPQAVRAFKPRISKQRNLAWLEPCLLGLRAWYRFGHPLRVRVESCSSWHFTYNGTPDRLRAKILAYSHTEKATPAIVEGDAIEKAVANRTYIFNAGEKFEVEPLGKTLPRCLQEDPPRWRGSLAGSVEPGGCGYDAPGSRQLCLGGRDGGS